MEKSYRIYLDVCCLNRPWDNQDQLRVRLETQAVNNIFEQFQSKTWQLISSPVLDAEISKIPNLERQIQVQSSLLVARIRVIDSPTLRTRASELVELGFSFYDAAHIASAERGRADVFLTTDDRLLRRATRFSDSIEVKVMNPTTWLDRVT